MTIFKLPDLGEGLAEAEIHEWHVKVGDIIKSDETMVSMETAKAVVDVPSPVTGRVVKLYGQVGDIIKTGEPLIEFATNDNVATVVGKMETSDKILQENAMGVTPSTSSGTNIKALPAVRALAKQLGVDLAGITGTGPNGQITPDDVKNAQKLPQQPASSSSAPAWTAQAEKIHGVRRSMAQGMAKSHAEVVPVTIFDEASIQAWEPKTDITVRMIQAICAACQREPALNTWFDGNQLVRLFHKEVHLGMAADTPDGLFVPVIKNADKLSPEALRETINRYKQELKDRSIAKDLLQGATITLSNFGNFAGRFATPIIVPPTVAIIATGRIKDHRIPISLTFDHRAVTGGEAARFLGVILEVLEKK